ncbi:MAG: hypothetical protein O6924_07010 [Alphaproteobacteria bacterium]|nr:hypothetical protein [Alphaproteobacteria bacterium]
MTAVPGGMDADLPDFHDRLVVARERLITRIIDEDDPGRALPDTAWVRMAADLHILILAVGDMIQDNKDTQI